MYGIVLHCIQLKDTKKSAKYEDFFKVSHVLKWYNIEWTAEVA